MWAKEERLVLIQSILERRVSSWSETDRGRMRKARHGQVRREGGYGALGHWGTGAMGAVGS